MHIFVLLSGWIRGYFFPDSHDNLADNIGAVPKKPCPN